MIETSYNVIVDISFVLQEDIDRCHQQHAGLPMRKVLGQLLPLLKAYHDSYGLNLFHELNISALWVCS